VGRNKNREGSDESEGLGRSRDGRFRVGVVMKIGRNIILLMLLGFSLSGFGIPGAGAGDGVGAACTLILIPMRKIAKHQRENIRKGFEVSVRTCDEKNYQAYREVL